MSNTARTILVWVARMALGSVVLLSAYLTMLAAGYGALTNLVQPLGTSIVTVALIGLTFRVSGSARIALIATIVLSLLALAAHKVLVIGL